MTSTPASPSPTPSPEPATLTLKTVVTDAKVALGAVVTGGEAILATLPSGPLHTGIAIALPVVAAVVTALSKLGG